MRPRSRNSGDGSTPGAVERSKASRVSYVVIMVLALICTMSVGPYALSANVGTALAQAAVAVTVLGYLVLVPLATIVALVVALQARRLCRRWRLTIDDGVFVEMPRASDVPAGVTFSIRV